MSGFFCCVWADRISVKLSIKVIEVDSSVRIDINSNTEAEAKIIKRQTDHNHILIRILFEKL